MLARTARYMAHELEYDADQEEVLHFGLQLVTNMVVGLVIISFLGFLLGALETTLFAFLVAGVLKVFAGGTHASSTRNCAIISALYFAPAGWATARWGPGLSFLVTNLLFVVAVGAALWAILRYAPAEPAGKPLLSRAHRDRMRAASFATLAVLSIVIPTLSIAGWHALFLAGIAGLAWETLVLTPLGDRIVARLDRLLNLPRDKEVKREMKKWFLNILASGLFAAALANVSVTTVWNTYQPPLPHSLRKRSD